MSRLAVGSCTAPAAGPLNPAASSQSGISHSHVFPTSKNLIFLQDRTILNFLLIRERRY
jgi:hypothetical protein